MVYDNNGKVKNFKDSAKLLKRSYIDSIELLSHGTIKYASPILMGKLESSYGAMLS